MTSRVITRNHLKLVSGRSGDQDAPHPRSGEPRGTQLRLQFDDEESVVLMHETEIPSSEGFLGFLHHYQPKWLFDVRVAPRMNFVAPTRALALKSLTELNVHYVDVLGRASNTAEWFMFVEQMLRGSRTVEGPFAFIFDDKSTLQDARVRLPSLLRKLDALKSVTVTTYPGNLIAM